MDWNPARSAARLAAPYSIDAAFQHSRDTMSRRTQRRFTSTMPRPLKARATGLPTVATPMSWWPLATPMPNLHAVLIWTVKTSFSFDRLPVSQGGCAGQCAWLIRRHLVESRLSASERRGSKTGHSPGGAFWPRAARLAWSAGTPMLLSVPRNDRGNKASAPAPLARSRPRLFQPGPSISRSGRQPTGSNELPPLRLGPLVPV